MSYLFPLAFMANTYAMTVLLIFMGLAGNPSVAADFGIVQGATVALFYAFSANARSLILKKTAAISAQSIMASRLVLLIPLAGLAYLLSVSVAGVGQFLALSLIARRCVEWLGEVHLGENERLDNKEFALRYMVFQVVLLTVVLVWLLSDLPYSLFGLLIWALAPLMLSVGYIWKVLTSIPDALAKVSSSILPHLGSTAIIGVTVYVFRLLILLIMGKENAGDLFTAFAIGGLTGGVFANALGPSIALHEQRSGNHSFPLLLKISLYLSLVLGAIIFASAFLALPILNSTGKTHFFWMATGLSLIGGVIMVYAQRIRFQLLQHGEDDVFGPDVIMNILLIAAVPFVFYLLGEDAMGGLYLISALFAFIFYLSSKKGNEMEKQLQLTGKVTRMVIAIMLIFPLFIQINSGVFHEPSMYFNSGGVLANLPIPLSVLACFSGIVILGAYNRAFISFSTIFFTCVLMVMTSVITTLESPGSSEAKLVLLVQFVLPMFALVLGQTYDHKKNNVNNVYVESMFFYVLAIIIPLQLISTWVLGYSLLVPNMWLFSIYQHLQYVPVIFVSAYLVALFALWQFPTNKYLLFILGPLMAVYTVMSMSMLAIGMLFIGFLGFAIYQWILKAEKLPVILFVLVTMVTSGFIHYQKDIISYKFGFLNNFTEQQEMRDQLKVLAPNVSERMVYWKYYIKQVTLSPKILSLGHAKPPDRTKYPSAHNYYLDFTYNFGLLALLPILVLLLYTCALAVQRRREIYLSPKLLGLCMVTLFLLIVDNSLKVGLRQPYPGIFTFFLWGLLLSRLLDLRNTKKLNEV